MNYIKIFLLLTLLSLRPLEGPREGPIEKPTPTSPNEVEECEEGVRDLLDDVRGLEFYLRDKKHRKKHCPDWKQPRLEEYKKDPRSYLPDGCKVRG